MLVNNCLDSVLHILEGGINILSAQQRCLEVHVERSLVVFGKDFRALCDYWRQMSVIQFTDKCLLVFVDVTARVILAFTHCFVSRHHSGLTRHIGVINGPLNELGSGELAAGIALLRDCQEVVAYPHAGVLEDHGLGRSYEVKFGVDEAMNVPRSLECDAAFAINKVSIRVLLTFWRNLVLADQVRGKLEGLSGGGAIDSDLCTIITDEFCVVLPEPAVPYTEGLHVNCSKAHTVHAAIRFRKLP